MRRPEKKSEILEVRLSHSAKRAFMERCRERGSSASEELRAFIDRYLAEPIDAPAKKVSPMPVFLKPLAIVAGAVPLGFAWLALSTTPVTALPDLRAMFEQLDADGNGAISRDEFTRSARGDALFVVRDTDAPPPAAVPFSIPIPLASRPGRGEIEVQPVPEQMLTAEYARQDRDGSGGVTFEEFAAHHEAMLRAGFASLDGNGDGGIDRTEHDAVIARLPRGGPRPDFSAIDRNGNGRIEWDEFVGPGR